jgi:hypothetical protein
MGQIRAAVSELDHEIIRMLAAASTTCARRCATSPTRRASATRTTGSAFSPIAAMGGGSGLRSRGDVEAMYRKLYEYTVQVQLELHRAKTGG